MVIRKLGIFFFILGSLISLFQGPFRSSYDPFIYGLIVFCGFFIGFFNITKEQENKFFLSTLVFIVTAFVFHNMFLVARATEPFRMVIFNFILFVSSAALIVSVKAIINLAAEREFHGFESKIKEKDRENASHRIWDVIILFSVSAMFIIFVLRQFFEVANFEGILAVFDFFIWVIFVVDLIIIYERYKDVKSFLKNAWLDLIAVIPFGLVAASLGQIGRLAKLGRLVKILRIVSKTGRGSKLLHLHNLSKFFSKDSSFNKYLYKKKKN